MIYIIIALLIWSSSFTAGKYAYSMFDPAMAIELRFIIASLIVLPFFIKTYPLIEKRIRTKLWGVSFLMFPIGIFMQFMGLFYTSASSAVVVIGTEPILVLVLGFLLFKTKVALYDWALSAIAFLGICLLVLGSKDDGAADLFGLILVFLAGAGFALSLYVAKEVMARLDNKVYTSTILVQGMMLCLPISLVLVKNWQINFN
ncbi:putative DMT superfamily transporter inner membrane protein [Moraxella caprae]|uniref:Putative DMT superfamily transporter inner membrane protein n=1 Tax=Moraxella caprae TaxID=90240 RepID=A0A378QYY5_9GAMM|nr:DMT family transporter [Moraxella caprae]STZ07601.1 putative DMT superfamily transporter inner membrane protein [Moraxella caprae]